METGAVVNPRASMHVCASLTTGFYRPPPCLARAVLGPGKVCRLSWPRSREITHDANAQDCSDQAHRCTS
eukprot:5677315-Pyramimonas_sp.AAC.1